MVFICKLFSLFQHLQRPRDLHLFLVKNLQYAESAKVGVCSAQVLEAIPGSLFWVVARLQDDLLPARRTSQKRASTSSKDRETCGFRKAQKVAVLEKYKMSKEDMAIVLEAQLCLFPCPKPLSPR